jgi:general secretion pathway protein I
LRCSAEHGFKSLRCSAEHGFTLIEMMVALAVFSLAALALLRLESATIRGAGIIDDTLLAETVARNVAIEALTDAQPPAIGTARGIEQNGGRAWSWTRDVRPVGGGRVLSISVAVAAPGGGTLGRLTMIRAGATS